jgi:SPP1 family predicted phage head-tail adaptor
MSFAATLRHKVSIQELPSGSDANGQPLTDWVELCAPYADILGTGGLETIKGGAVTSIVKKSIRIRYRTNVTAGMRVVHGVTIYNILAVVPDERGRVYTDLICETTG